MKGTHPMTHPHPNDALLPCPFCGGEAQIGTVEIETRSRGKQLGSQVYCSVCFAMTDSDRVNDNHEQALSRWNRRTPLPQGEEG